MPTRPDELQGRAAARVYLVGAGPGDPGLITVRGRELLQSADLVLYDGLVNPLLLQHTSARCERTARNRGGQAGATADRRSDQAAVVSQEEVIARLIDAAQAGLTVVRLKGGDPFIFGRGGEEAAALDAAGIPYEVVPGITAATAAAEYAGFSFTHRDAASAVAFITGHEDPGRQESRLDYNALVRFPGTLVFYMGLGRLSDICRQLLDHGAVPETPAAVISHASLATQRTVSGTLKTLPEIVNAAGIRPPSLIVVGDCVALRGTRPWFEQGDLFGLRIGITRSPEQALSTAEAVLRRSGQPCVLSLISIEPVSGGSAEPLRKAAAQPGQYDWLLFTSANAVDPFMNRVMQEAGDVRRLAGLRIAAVGSRTAEALSRWSIRADLVPTDFSSDALADALLAQSRQASGDSAARCLWVRGERAREHAARSLREAGIRVDEVIAYRSLDLPELPPETLKLLRNGDLHWVGLSSPAIAANYAELLKSGVTESADRRPLVAAISPQTAEAARACGLTVDAVAVRHTWDGILDAIADAARSERDSPD